jgi:integrase/recombinase XerC
MGAPPTLVHALQAMLNAHALDWARTQLRNCRGYLLSPTGRFQAWCQTVGIVSVDDLTTERVAAFLAAMADRDHGPGLKASTISRFRTHLRAFAHFQAETPGYGTGLHDIGRIRAPGMPREQFPLALSRDEEQRIVDACTTTRDRLIIELFLATGLRVSEMAALTLQSLRFSARPPRLAVTGSVHDPDCTKNCRPRNVAFRKSYNTLPQRLLDWIQTERDPQGRSPRQEVFLSAGDRHRAPRFPEALTIWGYESLCERVSLRAGVHFSPHVLRHTWATRLVDARVTPLHMMEVGGWSSIDMVSRYYTANDDEVLAAIAAASA